MALPTDYANLTGWWDASQESFANNDPVGTWTDRAGAGNHFTQAIAGQKPLFHTGIFPLGGPAIDFDGNDDYMATSTTAAGFIAASAFSYFAVVLVDSIATTDANPYANDAIWCDNSGYLGLHLHNTGPKAQFYNYDGTVDVAEKAITTGAAFVIHMRHESGNIYISVNGGAETSAASGNTGALTAVLRAGLNYTGTVAADIKVGEMFFYSVARSSGEITILNDYLTNKWITASTSYTGVPRPQPNVYRM